MTVMVTGFAAENARSSFGVALINVHIAVEKEIEHNG
jgi:hypothetical protein